MAVATTQRAGDPSLGYDPFVCVPDFVFEGLPVFDDQGYYTGPLPKTGYHLNATDQWPAKIAEWLARLALATCATTATTAVPDREPPTQLAIDIDGEPNDRKDLGYLEATGPPGDATRTTG